MVAIRIGLLVGGILGLGYGVSEAFLGRLAGRLRVGRVLRHQVHGGNADAGGVGVDGESAVRMVAEAALLIVGHSLKNPAKIGRASCRERV